MSEEIPRLAWQLVRHRKTVITGFITGFIIGIIITLIIFNNF